MSRAILMLLLVLPLTACGIKRPLVRPANIPAYEEKRAERIKKFAPPPENAAPDSSVPDTSGTTITPTMPQ